VLFKCKSNLVVAVVTMTMSSMFVRCRAMFNVVVEAPRHHFR
jgi:hypothetical protein